MGHVTFKQMMNEVVAFGSCCECGTCVLVCPHNVIDYIDGKPKQVAKASAALRSLRHQRGHRLRRVRAGLPPAGHPRVRHARRGPAARGRRVRRALRPLSPRRRGPLHGSGDPRALPGRRRGDRHPLPRPARGALRRRRACRPPTRPCPPPRSPRSSPRSTEAITSASSWYTYCPNDLALADAERMGLKQRLLRRRALPGDAGAQDPARRPGVPRQRPQEGEAHRAADEVPEGLRRDRRLHHRPAVHGGVHLRGPHGPEDRAGDGHPARRGEEVQREGEGARSTRRTARWWR